MTPAKKRSASAIPEAQEVEGLSPEVTVSCASFSLPYNHYAMIYIDNEGIPQTIESRSIQEESTSVFTPEVRQNFLQILGSRIGYPQPNRQAGSGLFKRQKRNSSISQQLSDEQGSENNDFLNGTAERTPLEIGDTKNVMAYYRNALNNFQQLNCRMIAKAFIKFIEPRKQVKHPYNGGKLPLGSAPGTTVDPEKTKPEWWPPSIIHKEPDHLRKEYRIELILHILRKLGRYGITAKKLRDVAQDTKRSLKRPSHIEIIDEILRVRRVEELFEQGQVDASLVVYPMKSQSTRETKNDKDDASAKATSVILGVSQQTELGLATESVEQRSAALATTANPHASASGHSCGFSMPKPLDFKVAGLQNHPNYTTRPQYTDSLSRPMLSTSETAETFRPQSALFFNYPGQNSFLETTLDHQYIEASGHYDAGLSTDLYPNASRYGSATSGRILPPRMHYDISPASANLQRIAAHYSQAPEESMTQNSWRLRTESTGHPYELPPYHPT
ncbi:hypothetical protein PENSOL_c011G06425 [Penicillium solitum]|uniref:Subtelomeric hrmA-associated cluster protein AFUB-079030/YDR124W-like helical bundle domain-containing protein n=1 Tax=Penicillium solitum TaxID=60172 RepID=A0A1V6R8L7_9EURO|nr:uncharacterized protein PENSOL_c011G06425 [Penicillium solitum]OQD97643.1 hypothetical protein PENSOL_c011G06425 [Penicillium solitum]